MQFFAKLVIAISVLLAGCSTVSNSGEGGMSPNHPNDFLYGKEKEKVQTYMNEIGTKILAQEDLYYKETDNDKRTTYRNNIAGLLQGPIDEFYRRYTSAFYGNNALLKTSIEGTTGILSGAAAIASPAGAKSILAALSAAVGGLGTSYEKNVLQQQTTTALLHQMEADVALYGQVISLGLAKKDSEYPLAKLYADLQTYSRAMSVPHALAAMTASSGAQAKAIKQDIADDVSKQLKTTPAATTQSLSIRAPALVPFSTQTQIK